MYYNTVTKQICVFVKLIVKVVQCTYSDEYTDCVANHTAFRALAFYFDEIIYFVGILIISE